ncbi:MAG: RNA methyltransferase [Candidatus Solibacter usitatus]|nr:RNA methyltransferase [Candidatus Solibacter usitatus]
MPLAVVLVAPRNPLNIGAAARAMKNFGFADLRLVNPYHVAFREARSAVGAASVLRAALEYASVADAVADAALVVGTTSVGHRQPQHPLRKLEPGAREMRRRMQPGNVALLFGSEKFGLSNDDLSHCHWLLRISTADPDQSMNLGQAVAVCLYELTRNPRGRLAPVKARKPARAGDLEQITRMLLELCRESGYVNPVVAGSTENKIRRLVRRLDLSAADAPLWLGILRQALWKLHEKSE